MTALMIALMAASIVTGYAFAQSEGTAMPSDPPRRSEPLPLPRDPDIAVREEFDAARASATIEAWELFLARHGGHRLAQAARQELEKIKQKR